MCVYSFLVVVVLASKETKTELGLFSFFLSFLDEISLSFLYSLHSSLFPALTEAANKKEWERKMEKFGRGCPWDYSDNFGIVLKFLSLLEKSDAVCFPQLCLSFHVAIGFFKLLFSLLCLKSKAYWSAPVMFGVIRTIEGRTPDSNCGFDLRRYSINLVFWSFKFFLF